MALILETTKNWTVRKHNSGWALEFTNADYPNGAMNPWGRPYSWISCRTLKAAKAHASANGATLTRVGV